MPKLRGIVRQTVALFEQTLVARSPEERKKTRTETMLQAHEALCEAAPENMLRYKDVLDFLRQELHYDTPPK